MANQGDKKSNNNNDFKTMYQPALKNVALQKKQNASIRKHVYLLQKSKIMKETND